VVVFIVRSVRTHSFSLVVLQPTSSSNAIPEPVTFVTFKVRLSDAPRPKVSIPHRRSLHHSSLASPPPMALTGDECANMCVFSTRTPYHYPSTMAATKGFVISSRNAVLINGSDSRHKNRDKN
jgi:hypothetical protein